MYIYYLKYSGKYVNMIKNIGLSLKNLGSKFLIIVIALSFAVWGIGDIFVKIIIILL